MKIQTLSHYTGMNTRSIERLLTLSAGEIYTDPEYLEALDSLDRDYLEATLASARAVYEKGLPQFMQNIERDYGINAKPMSAYTLGNWIVGILAHHQHASKMIDFHQRIPPEAIIGALPSLLTMLEDLPEGAQIWQKALALLSFPMMSHN